METVFWSTVEARYFPSTDNLAAALGLASTHLAALSKARVAAAEAFGFRARNLPFTMTAPVLARIGHVHGLVSDVAHLALCDQHAADGLGIRDGVHFPLVQCEPQFAGGKNQPGHVLAGVD